VMSRAVSIADEIGVASRRSRAGLARPLRFQVIRRELCSPHGEVLAAHCAGREFCDRRAASLEPRTTQLANCICCAEKPRETKRTYRHQRCAWFEARPPLDLCLNVTSAARPSASP